MKTIKRLYWRIYIIRLCLRWIFNFNLGDVVIYKGERFILTQGVSCPYWNMSKKGGGQYVENVHQDNFKKERSVSNYVHSFRSAYKFYMGYWFDIWARNGIQPWMRSCKIWGK